MTPEAAWAPAREALDRAGAAGRTVSVWLRDDDAVAPTPALDRLDALCRAHRVPVLLAVIPRDAGAPLARWAEGRAHVLPCQHGWGHDNHAAPGARACELGGARPLAAAVDDVARGRARMRALFGASLRDVLVPPWNRIDPALIPRLPGLGIAALSCFGPTPPAEDGMPRLDSDVDVIDWRGGRVGRTLGDVARKVAGTVARQDALGLLAHHLAHDAAAWGVLDEALARLAAHPAVRVTDADALLAGVRRPGDGRAGDRRA